MSTTIRRRVPIADESLSFRARGVYEWIQMMREHGWDDSMSIARIAENGTEGTTAIRAAVRELEAAGLLVRHRIVGSDGLLRWTYEVKP